MLDVTQDPRPASGETPRDGGSDFARAIRGQTEGYVDKRKHDVARAVSDVADAIRDSGSGFAEQPNVKAFFDNAAEGVTELSEGISRRSFGELYDDVDAAVRRQPGIALAAAALAGFALFRFFKASELRPIPRSRSVVSADVFPTPDI